MDEYEALAIAAAAKKRKGGVSTDSQAVDEFQRKGKALLLGAGRGGTLGLVDDMAGAGAAVKGALTGDFRVGENFRQGRDQVRAVHQQAQQTDPTSYGGGEFIGGAIQGLGSAPAATGKTLLGTMLRGAGIGALEGGIYGGAGNDGRGDVLANTARGAGIGAGIGLLAPAVVAGAQGTARAATDPATGLVDALTNRANKGKASRAIVNTLGDNDPRSVTRAITRAAAEGQPDYRLMDALGVSGQRRASGLVRSGGGTADELAEFLKQRQLGQPERLSAFTEDAFDLRGTSANQARSALKAGRDQAADLDFGAIRSSNDPVDIRGALGAIDARVKPFEDADIQSPARKALTKLRKQLAGNDDTYELSDFSKVFAIRKQLRDDISAAYRKGRNELASDLKAVRSALDDALEDSNSSYRDAMESYANASRTMDAVEEGANMARPGQRATDTVDRFSQMDGSEQGAARAGYGDRALARIESAAGDTTDRTRPLRSPKVQSEIDAIATEPDLFKRRISREQEMWETQNRALGGSRTADNLQDIESTGEVAAGTMGAVRSAANMQFGDAAARIAGMLAPIAKGQNEATRRLIAEALLSSDPQKYLAPALRKEMRNQSGRRLIESMLRSGGRLRADQY